MADKNIGVDIDASVVPISPIVPIVSGPKASQPQASRAALFKKANKICVSCGETKPLNEFYANKLWGDQSCHDAWCKACANSKCTDEESLKVYCWANNRKWTKALYDSAVKKSKYYLANDSTYMDKRTTERRKRTIENKAIAKAFFGVMNLAVLYEYSPNITKDGENDPYNPDVAAMEKRMEDKQDPGASKEKDHSPDVDNGALMFSRVWNGTYTQREIDYLDDYYAHLEEDFVLDNQNIQDYARKAAKASLDADIKYNRMRQRQCSAMEWEKAQGIFDNLSKSANFAACKRKPGETAGLGSLGEIVYRIEMSGDLDMPMVEFPKDDIDKIIEDFRHIAEAIGLDGVK